MPRGYALLSFFDRHWLEMHGIYTFHASEVQQRLAVRRHRRSKLHGARKRIRTRVPRL